MSEKREKHPLWQTFVKWCRDYYGCVTPSLSELDAHWPAFLACDEAIRASMTPRQRFDDATTRLCDHLSEAVERLEELNTRQVAKAELMTRQSVAFASVLDRLEKLSKRVEESAEQLLSHGGTLHGGIRRQEHATEQLEAVTKGLMGLMGLNLVVIEGKWSIHQPGSK